MSHAKHTLRLVGMAHRHNHTGMSQIQDYGCSSYNQDEVNRPIAYI